MVLGVLAEYLQHMKVRLWPDDKCTTASRAANSRDDFAKEVLKKQPQRLDYHARQMMCTGSERRAASFCAVSVINIVTE